MEMKDSIHIGVNFKKYIFAVIFTTYDMTSELVLFAVSGQICPGQNSTNFVKIGKMAPVKMAYM